MKPDAIDPEVARDVVRQLRSKNQSADVSDETLANLIEHGLGSVPTEQRAPLLRAIGNSPDIAAVVAELAPAVTAAQATPRSSRVLGLPAPSWRIAWAACALLAVGLTLWDVGATGSAGSEITVLDGGVDGPSQDFADSLHQSLRRKTVILLWSLLAILSAPALLSLRRSAEHERLQPSRIR